MTVPDALVRAAEAEEVSVELRGGGTEGVETVAAVAKALVIQQVESRGRGRVVKVKGVEGMVAVAKGAG